MLMSLSADYKEGSLVLVRGNYRKYYSIYTLNKLQY